MFETKLEIPNNLTDNPYRHVSHVEILRLFEQCRFDYMVSIGHSHESFLARGLYIVIASINIQYKREVRTGTFRITIDEIRNDDKSLFMTQRIYNEKGKVCVEAIVENKFLDQGIKRAVLVPEIFRIREG